MLNIENLIIVAGLSRSGKSTLINKLQNGELLPLCNELDVNSISSYPLFYAIALRDLNQPIAKAIIHYDFLSRYTENGIFENLDHLLAHATKIKVITACASPKILTKRAELSVYKLLEQLAKEKGNTPYKQHLPLINTLKNRISIDTIYKSPSNIINLYDHWFNFFKQHSALDHWLIDTQQPNKFIRCPDNKDDIWDFIENTAYTPSKS